MNCPMYQKVCTLEHSETCPFYDEANLNCIWVRIESFISKAWECEPTVKACMADMGVE